MSSPSRCLIWGIMVCVSGVVACGVLMSKISLPNSTSSECCKQFSWLILPVPQVPQPLYLRSACLQKAKADKECEPAIFHIVACFASAG